MTEPTWDPRWDVEDLAPFAAAVTQQKAGNPAREPMIKRYTFVLRTYLEEAKAAGFRGAVERTVTKLDYLGISKDTIRRVANEWQRRHDIPRMLNRPAGAKRTPKDPPPYLADMRTLRDIVYRVIRGQRPVEDLAMIEGLFGGMTQPTPPSA